jgi:hypothetical protein
LGKDFTFRVTNQEYRMLRALATSGNKSPSDGVNGAIEAAPEEYLQRKPDLLHVQLSDSSVKKLNKVAKKYKLSYATLIERAIDWRYRTEVLEAAKRVANSADEVLDNKRRPLAPEIEAGMQWLLRLVLPFGPFGVRFSDHKPYMKLGEGWRTPYEPQTDEG